MVSSSIKILALIPPLIASSRLNTKCPGGLICHHGGECSTGDQPATQRHTLEDLPWTEQLNINNEHCINCHDGFGGVDCSRKYEICDPDDTDSPTCFNGSKCLKMGIDADTGKFDYMCDCSAAADLTGGQFQYAGQFCQHVEEMKCDDEMFCTNGGECIGVLSGSESGAQYGHFECKCPEGRSGTHCEFLDSDSELSECSLKCERGVCAKGVKSYAYLLGSGAFPPELATDLMSDSREHCVCPKGYTGLKCEIEVNICGGSKFCYHGASCISDSSGQPMCDCNTAHTDGKSYAGLSCEHVSSSFCTPGDEQDQKDSFCVNGGKCIEDPDTRHEGCECPEGYSGDLCEIQSVAEPTCTLDCENGGSCRFGVKGVKDSYDDLGLLIFGSKEINGMYCSCPSGFTGVRCESEVNHCHVDGADTGHFCLNGTPCSSEDPNLKGVTKKYGCQCNGEDETNDEITEMLAGRFCEYAVTEFCVADGEHGGSHSFCTNGGKCKKRNKYGDDVHHGCCCPEGFEGDFCQFRYGTLKEGAPVTWSALEECTKKESALKSTVVESTKFTEGGIEESKASNKATAKKSSTTATLFSLLAVMMVGGVIGFIYLKRDHKEAHEYDADAVWPPPKSNLAPLGRTWSYPAGHDAPANWEYSEKHGALHDVVI